MEGIYRLFMRGDSNTTNIGNPNEFTVRQLAELVIALTGTSSTIVERAESAASAEMGNTTSASAHVAEVLKLAPDFTIANYLGTMHYKQPGDLEHHREALTKAGLPA